MATAGAWRGAEEEGVCHLAAAKAGAIHRVPATAPLCAAAVPAAETGVGGAVAWAGKTGVPGLEKQMSNRVKKCSGCGKPNAYTLTVCNSCGTALPTEETTTPNVFMCFVYGFEATKLSLRYQDENLMVLDDMLSLSPAHFNAVWARDWIPDVRFLFSRPKEGREVLEMMRAKCRHVMSEQFDANAEYRRVLLKDGAPPPSELVMDGMNFPPSQYQLHLQFIGMPMLPFHYALYLKGGHYTKGRFFPCDFVLAGLEAAEAHGGIGFSVDAETSIDRIVAQLKEWGVDYDTHWQAAYDRCGDQQQKWANWLPERFDSVVAGGKVRALVVAAEGGGVSAGDEVADKKTNDMVEEDKLLLQNYGRPYEDGKPAAKHFYGHAKAPGQCRLFGT